MEAVETPVDALINAVKFGVSNVKTLLIWGSAYLIVMILYFVLYMVSIFAIVASPILGIALFIAAFVPLLVFSLLYGGFGTQCIRALLAGEAVAPTGLENPVQLVKDGFCTFLLGLEYTVFSILLMVPGFIVMLLAYYAGDQRFLVLMLGMLLMFVALIPCAILVFLLLIQWIIFADTGSILSGLNPLRSIRLIIAHPGDALIAIGQLFVMYLVTVAIVFVCEMLVCPVLLIPFLAVGMALAFLYVIVRFYQKCTATAPEDMA